MYPMTYPRLVERNHLSGNYGHADAAAEKARLAVAGDLRRLERDQRDAFHLARYAEHAGVTEEQADAVLAAFLTYFDAVPLVVLR